MQSQTDEQNTRRGRPGSWQYPSAALPLDDGEVAATTDALLLQPPGRERSGGAEQWSSALGWLSIGLGAIQLLAPRTVARGAGLPDSSPRLMRALGVREVVCGVGLLSQRAGLHGVAAANGVPPYQRGARATRATALWRWSRVAGDAMDLAMLGGAAARASSSQRRRLAATAAVVAGLAVLDVLASARASGRSAAQAALTVEKTLCINRSPDECYRFWRKLEQLPRFMAHLDAVHETGARSSHWIAKGPAGARTEWDAEITDDQPGRRLAWRSLPGAEVDNHGVVEFLPAPAGRGTVLRVRLHYAPPAGVVGTMAASLFGEAPSQQVEQDIRHFKQLIETGEIATTKGQPSGPRSLAMRLFKKVSRT